MNRSLVTRTLALAAAAGFTTAAMADDLTPPSWRFNAGTTVQHWDFSAGPTGGAPDALPLNNSFGTPLLLPGGGASWMPSFSGRNDVWNLAAGSIDFFVPNTGNQNNQKNLWLQVTYFAAAPSPPSYLVAGPNGLFNMVGGPQVTPLANGWFHELTQWTTPICPPFERVTIQPAIPGAVMMIDQVVIDTQCIVPTPGTASLLCLGGLFAARRRRR